MLVRKTAKTVIKERKKERSIHDITESAVSQCVIIFDRISHTSGVHSKINFVLGNLSQLYSSCKHCDNSKLFSTLRLTTPCYSNEQSLPNVSLKSMST